MKEYSYGICPYRIKNYSTQIMLIQAKGHDVWGFIKGKIDNNETITECAKRETKEETNIKFKKKHLEDYFEQKNKKKNVGIFLIDEVNLDLSNIILEEREIHKIQFFDLMQIKDEMINKNQTQILNKIKDKFSKRIYYFCS